MFRKIIALNTSYKDFQVNIIVKEQESLIIPGLNHCMFGNSGDLKIKTTFDRQIKPIRGNVFAIGDIHGMLKKLVDLVSIINPSGKDILLFLGDYIDKGDESKGVIDFLDDLQTKTECVFLGGNHEYMYLHADDYWMANGGLQTMFSYKVPHNFNNITKKEMIHKFKIPKEITEKLWGILVSESLANNNETLIDSPAKLIRFTDLLVNYSGGYGITIPDHILVAQRAIPLQTHMKFFKNLRDYAWTLGSWENHYYFSHAGIDPSDLVDTNKKIGISPERDYLLKSGHQGAYKYIFVHTPVVRENMFLFDSRFSKKPFNHGYPFVTPGYVCIDTGAFLDGPLTAMEIPSGEFISSY